MHEFLDFWAMSRLDVKISMRDLIKDNNYKHNFISKIDRIISEYTCDVFVDTLKLSDISRLIDLRSFLSKIFLNFFKIDSDLCLKYRRGDNASSSLAYDIFILSHCLVDKKLSKEIDNIFNINIKPSDFIKKKDDLNNKINYIFRTVNSIDTTMTMDTNMQGTLENLSADQKLDLIFNSLTEIKSNVITLKSTVEELKSDHNTLKSTLNNKIIDVCREMLNTSTNNNHPSIISANTQSVNNLENSTSKKRSRHDLQYDNEDDYSAKDFNLISVNDDSISTSKNNRRKGIYGSNESTNFKTGTVPFNVYVGNVHLDTKDEEVSQLFNNNGLKVIYQCRIETRSKFSKAYRVTIPRDQSNLINDSGLWPKDLILNRFTFSKEEKLAFRSFKSNNNKPNNVLINRGNRSGIPVSFQYKNNTSSMNSDGQAN